MSQKLSMQKTLYIKKAREKDNSEDMKQTYKVIKIKIKKDKYKSIKDT